MNSKLRIICYLIVFFLLSAQTRLTNDDVDQGFHKLFNEKNFEGWYIATRDGSSGEGLFAVEQGMIHVYPHQEEGSLQTFAGLITEQSYQDYHLTLEYRWGKKKFQPRHEFVRDAGVLVHVFGPDQIWPNGAECQIQEGDTGDLWLIGTRASSKVSPVIRNHSSEGKTESRGGTGEARFSRFHRSYCWEKEGWNKLELIVEGNHLKFWVNGHLVNEAQQLQFWDQSLQAYQDLYQGKILLQAEGAEIYYRNIYLKNLKP